MSDFKVVKLLGNPIQINLSQGINFTGEYDNLTAYVLGDSVSYLGSSYVATQNTTGNLPTNVTYWQLLAEKGAVEDSFETVNKNIKAWNYTLAYTGPQLTSITYTDGVDTIVKTLAYTGDQLTSITLSGDTPAGIDLIKTLGYTGPNLTSITYS